MQDEPKRTGSRGRPRKHGAGSRHVGFMLQQEHYDLVKRTADVLGLDVAPVLNLIIANSVPFLRARLEQHATDVAALRAALERKESA